MILSGFYLGLSIIGARWVLYLEILELGGVTHSKAETSNIW